jgi:IS5 family transposase
MKKRVRKPRTEEQKKYNRLWTRVWYRGLSPESKERRRIRNAWYIAGFDPLTEDEYRAVWSMPHGADKETTFLS